MKNLVWSGVLIAAVLICGFCPVLAGPAAENPSGSAPAAGPAVNVNTAGTEELASLPGVGPALAKRIVDYRAANGPFNKPEDLLAVKGVGAKLLARIKDRLVFSPPPGKKG